METKNMEHHSGDGLPGLFLTVGLWVATSAMNLISGMDSLLMLFVHTMQGLAFAGTLIAALCTASPTFKARFEGAIKSLFKKKQ